MELDISRPICFFDLETTGINVAKDRIVEISILKIYPDGREVELTERINPTVPIPAETTAVHGISDADVVDKPTFAQRAKDIHEMIKDSDLAGFNSNRFDIPLLVEDLSHN